MPDWTASVMRRFSPSRDHRSERAQQCGRNIQKNRCRTTVLSRFGETLGKLPFTRDQVVYLGTTRPPQAATETTRLIRFRDHKIVNGMPPILLAHEVASGRFGKSR